MTIQLNAAYQAVKSNIPAQFCTPKAQIISLIALGILSSGVAIYAANFLVALPLTVATLTIGSGLVSLVSFVAAGFIYSSDNTKKNITYLKSRVTQEELTLILNNQATRMTFVEFFKFHGKAEAFTFLTEENRLIYKKQFMEAARAGQMPSVSIADFKTNPEGALGLGLWLEAATLERFISATDPLLLSETVSLLEIFNLKELSSEFTAISQEAQRLTSELREKLQEIDQKKASLEEKYASAKEKCQSDLPRKIEKLKVAFEEKSTVKSFRAAEKELKRIENSIRDVVSQKEYPRAELQRLLSLEDSREKRMADQEAIIQLETPKKAAKNAAIRGEYSRFGAIPAGELAEKKLAAAYSALAYIKDEPNKIESLRQEILELESKKEQLEAEKTSAIRTKNKWAYDYLYGKSALDRSIKYTEEEAQDRILSLDKALAEKIVKLEPEILGLVEKAIGESDVEFGELYLRFTAFTERYNALFS